MEHKKDLPEDGFWYVSVGGYPTEIVRIHEGEMYSIGCADGHGLEGVELISRLVEQNFPKSKKASAEQEALWEKNLLTMTHTEKQEAIWARDAIEKPGNYQGPNGYRRF